MGHLIQKSSSVCKSRKVYTARLSLLTAEEGDEDYWYRKDRFLTRKAVWMDAGGAV